MDELPPIRNLSLTQQRIRDALKNAPPLTINKKSNDDFIVFDNQKKKKNENSLFDRFLKQRTMDSNNLSENNDPKKRGYKWSQLKDIMIEELETKRMVSQKYIEINERIENEELYEVEDQSDTPLAQHIEDNKEDENDFESKHKDYSNGSDEEIEEEIDSEEEIEEEIDSEEEIEEEIDSEEEIEEEIDSEEVEESEEEEESDRELNPFVDDEADEEVLKDVETISETHSNDSRDWFDVSNHQKEQSIVEECNEDNDMNDVLDTSHSLFNESFERKCATQKIALSPFITQKPKPRFDSTKDFSELISGFNSNNEEFNSQSLLDLCSGNFTENDRQIDFQTEKEPEDTHCSYDENSDHNSDSEDNEEEYEEVFSRQKKVFNIESDNESETDLKNIEEIKTCLKSFNESDGEELIVTDEDEGNEETEDCDNEEHNVNTFFDDEAELSGSDDVSSDEDDAEDEAQEEEAEQEDLPSDSEIEDQNKRFFNKQILDEEKRNIMIWKERLFEDGDLHDGGPQRKKKFRWNFQTDDNFVNDYINEDSDDNYMDSDEDEKIKTPTLKMSDNSEIENKVNKNSEKLELNFKQNFDLKNNKKMGSEAKNSSISAFVVRDQRLKTIMSFKNKRSLNSKNSFKSNKKFKSSKKNTKTSIFDLLNPNNNSII